MDRCGRDRQRVAALPVDGPVVPGQAAATGDRAAQAGQTLEPGGLRGGSWTVTSLERLHTEIKRRIRSAGAFPDRASALRLITAVALRTTALWSERRYLDLSLLEPKEVAKAA